MCCIFALNVQYVFSKCIVWRLMAQLNIVHLAINVFDLHSSTGFLPSMCRIASSKGQKK